MQSSNSSNFAFFDVDGTLISIKSMFSFQDYWYRQLDDDDGSASRQEAAFRAEMRYHEKNGTARTEINRRYYTYFAGRRSALVSSCALQWFRHIEKTVRGLYNIPVIKQLESLQRSDVEPVFVSGSLVEILEPLAEKLGVSHIIATRLTQKDGYFTGEIVPPQTIGTGKADAVRSFLLKNHASSRHCYAFGDDPSDIPMLEAVSRPVAIAGNPELEQHARQMNWKVLSTTPQRDTQFSF